MTSEVKINRPLAVIIAVAYLLFVGALFLQAIMVQRRLLATRRQKGLLARLRKH